MKALILRSEFSKLIGKIQSVIPAKPSVPILANVLIEAENDQLIISATDLSVSMRVHGEARVTQSGAITLPARRLFQLARELTTPEIEIETTSPEIAILHTGSSHFRIQGMHKSEFPTFPDLSAGFEIVFKASVLKEILAKTAFAAARDDSRQTLNGILMQKIDNLATFVGTDGKRLARNRIEITTESSEPGSYILPLKAVEEIIKMLDDKEEGVKLVLTADKLSLESDRTVLITKLLSGQYPDVSRVIPKQTDKGLLLHRD